MTPWILVALLAGFAIGWVGRSVRAAAREQTLRDDLDDTRVEAAAATFAWDQAVAANVQLLKESADQWDDARGKVDP
jgi:hypothetical protein